MCGIIGIATKQESELSGMLKKSLRRLTYRGYDSYGVAILNGNQIYIKKGVGRAENLRLPPEIKGNAGIGHTRWATHGKVTVKNAHPHTDCTGNIAVVHNGIIDNHSQLRQELEQLGHQFISETDTEVIPHLIEERLKFYIAGHKVNPFLEAFRDTIQRLNGSYAIVALWNGDGKLYAARRISPLLIGMAQDSNFVASDISAFLEYTNRFMPLDDNRIAVVSVKDVELYNASDNIKLERLPVIKREYPFGIERMSKGKYKHFMLKEIQEQDEVLRTLSLEQDKIDGVAEKLAHVLSSQNKVRQIYFTGCGSSFHACFAGEYIFERLLHIPSKAVLSSEFKTTIKNINLDDSLIVVLSQSGETLDTYMVLDAIGNIQKKPHVLLVVNNPLSFEERLVRDKLSDYTKILHLHAGPEICVVATKTYTAELYLLALLALKIGDDILPDDRKMEIAQLLKDAGKIPEKVRNVLDYLDAQATILAQKYTHFTNKDVSTSGNRENIFVIGRGINIGNAYETALKFREICYISALGIAGGELKHGSLAAVDRNTPVIVLFPPQTDLDVWKSTLNNFREIQARGAPIISICCNGEIDKQVQEFSEDTILVSGTNWLFSPILQMTFLHLLSYRMALKKGDINPDNPQHLAKSVTVE